MNRRSPAMSRATSFKLLFAVIALTFFAKACAEQPSTTDTNYEPTAPQLAAGGSASCTAPCVEVEVKAKPGNAVAEGVLVTLVQGGQSGVGPFDQNGVPLFKLTNSNGVAVFDAADFDLIGTSTELGYCAHVRPLTSVADATGGGPVFIVPNGTPPSPSAPFQTAVTGPRLRSEVLTKKSYLDNCVRWSTPGQAPFAVTPTTAQRVSLTVNATGATLGVRCRFFDGGTAPSGAPGDECPTWTLMDLGVDENNNPISIPWQPLLDPGVQVGLLISGSSGANSANNNGLAFEETYEVEAALQGGDKQYTASLTNKKTAKGGKKDGTVTNETADMDPLVCIEVSQPAESVGEVATGIDFLSPMRDGYLGELPLNSALFVADAEHVTIYYDQVNRGGSAEVQLHMRAKQNPLFPPDGFSSTMNKVVKYNFAACPSGQPTIISESGSAQLVVEVECRATLSDPTITHVVWSISIPGSRLVEWRLQTPFDESHPEEARNDDTRAMRPIAFPVGADGQIGGGDDCPLANSSIGKTNDPKWWTTG